MKNFQQKRLTGKILRYRCGMAGWSLALVCFCIILFGNVQMVSAQTRNVTIDVVDTPIGKVFDELSKQTRYKIFYSDNVIDSKQKVSVSFVNKPLKEALNKLLEGTGVGFEIKSKKVLLFKIKESSSSPDSKKESNIMISGSVIDENGEPIIGATITSEKTLKGTITDLDGKFSLEIPENTNLAISYVGYRNQIVKGYSNMIIRLQEDSRMLDEVVVVGYGTQRKGNLTGAVSSVKADKLTIAPVATASNTLVGQLPGLIATQSSGQPGSDSATLNVRGFGSALIIVDGIEASLDNIDANQIESISILKDGAASIYGARAGNGVILITTKRGTDQKPMITLNTTFTWQGVTKMLKPASSGQRAEMEREAWLQSGQSEASAPFTEDQIQKYYDGTDPLFPNTNWYKELIRDWAPEQQHNISIRGGNDRLKFYGFFGYLNQETMIKKNGGNYERFNLQSNIDAKILDNLTLRLDLAYSQEQRNYTTRSMGVGGSIWQDYWNTLPYYPATLPDPDKIPYAFGAGVGGLHVSSNRDISGYDDARGEDLRGTASLEYKFKSVKGLSIKMFESYRKVYSFNKIFNKPVDLYTYDPASDIYTLAGTYGSKASLSQAHSRSEMFTQQYSINYENNFNDTHHLTAMALYEAINYSGDYLFASRKDFMMTAIDQMFAGSTEGMTNNGYANEMGRMSFVGRVNYSYKNKYLLETILRADASAKFPPGKRWGYFPSVSVGWMLSEEKFISQVRFIDNLKLRLSYGQSGNDGVGNFQYLSGYTYGHAYLLGKESVQGMVSTGLANPNLTWEKVEIANIGIDYSFFNRKLYGEVDVFYRERTGIPATRLMSLPSTFGANLPPENINSLNDRGFEVKLGTSGAVNQLKYDVSGNISWSRAKWKYYEEPDYTDSDQARIFKQSGKWTDCVYGYVSDGLFTSQAEIDAAPYYEDLQGNTMLKPGDVRYKDLNGDGIINWKDQKEIGGSTMPHWIYGLNVALSYKGFDLSMLFQGAFGYNQNISNGLYSTLLYEERWSPENNDANAIYARLGGASTNNYTSDFTYKKAGYLRLKVASLGYSLPRQFLEKCHINNARVYLSGTNLLTFNRLGKYGIDPEAQNVGYYYPQQRTISLGLNISF